MLMCPPADTGADRDAERDRGAVRRAAARRRLKSPRTGGCLNELEKDEVRIISCRLILQVSEH